MRLLVAFEASLAPKEKETLAPFRPQDRRPPSQTANTLRNVHTGAPFAKCARPMFGS